jgi:hypothetical protein
MAYSAGISIKDLSIVMEKERTPVMMTTQNRAETQPVMA